MSDLEHTVERLFERLDALKDGQAEITQKLAVHVAGEQEWQNNIEAKIDTHIAEHSAAANVWRKGAVGALFMIVGTMIAWVASFIWTHRGV